MFGVECAEFHHFVHGGDGLLCSGGHHRSEVARSLAVSQVAPTVAAVGLEQRQLGMDWHLQYVVLAVDLAGLLGRSVGVFRQFGTVAGGREECADAGAGGADALGQIALRYQFELQLAAAIQPVKNLAVGLTREAADDLAHPACLEQCGQADLGIAGIVVDDGQVGGALLDQAIDQFIGNARGAKTADHDGGAVAHVCQCLGNRAGNLVDHGVDSSIATGVGRHARVKMRCTGV